MSEQAQQRLRARGGPRAVLVRESPLRQIGRYTRASELGIAGPVIEHGGTGRFGACVGPQKLAQAKKQHGDINLRRTTTLAPLYASDQTLGARELGIGPNSRCPTQGHLTDSPRADLDSPVRHPSALADRRGGRSLSDMVWSTRYAYTPEEAIHARTDLHLPPTRTPVPHSCVEAKGRGELQVGVGPGGVARDDRSDKGVGRIADSRSRNNRQ